MAHNETSIKKIQARDWDSIVLKWAAYIPEFTTPGDSPPFELTKFGGLLDVYSRAAADKVEYREEVALLRQEILREGIYLIHKSIHVSAAALLHVENGFKSWALSNAYQSSFFAVKGILALLGLSFPRMSKILMIDCFPKDEELSKSALKKGRIPKVDIRFNVLNELSHVEYWQILQRIIRVSNIPCWQPNILEYIKHLPPEKFVQERNSLHYKNHYWTFPKDLFNVLLDRTFGIDPELLAEYGDVMDNCEHQYDLFINYTLILLALKLVSGIATLSADISEEYNLMLATIRNGFHFRMLSTLGPDL
jgi:hypothetical protein